MSSLRHRPKKQESLRPLSLPLYPLRETFFEDSLGIQEKLTVGNLRKRIFCFLEKISHIMTKKRVIDVMNDQRTTFNDAAVASGEDYRKSRTQLFAARKELGNKNPNDARRAAQQRADAVNHRALVLNRV